LFFGHAQNPRLHSGQRAIRLPAPQPTMRGTLRGPLRSMGDITPPAAGHQDIQQRIQYLPKRRMWHPTATLLRGGGQDILEQAPL